jgi:uncharacterized protein YeaO (DUF488 family)
MAERIRIKRAYEPGEPGDGPRYLIDRMWPRGIAKPDLQIEAWVKDAAPSTALRRWFGHDPEKWNEFRKRYFAELDANPEAWKPLLDAARKHAITLVYGAKDEAHNNAVALAEYLEKHMGGRTARARS